MNDSYVGCRQCSLRSACVLPIAVVKGRFCLPLPDIGRFADEWLDLNSANQNRFNSWRQQNLHHNHSAEPAEPQPQPAEPAEHQPQPAEPAAPPPQPAEPAAPPPQPAE